MEYLELKIKPDKYHLEDTEELLIDSGFTAMMIDDPEDIKDIAAHPDIYRYDYINEALTEDLDRNPVITLFFSDDEEGRAELARAKQLLECGMPGISMESSSAGDDSEWLYKWQEHFKPTKVGSRIVVKPSWEEYEPGDGELVIKMDPGMAFGSGLHETTSMCIRALEDYIDRIRQDKAGSQAGTLRVLDVGTGTGILAIAAVLLGADAALGIDIDPDAVRVAEDNIEHNGLADSITVKYGDLTEGVSYKADIITANLMADLVIRLSPAAAGHLAPGGLYITSGILDIKEDVVSDAIRKAGFRIEQVLREGEWRAIVAAKE